MKSREEKLLDVIQQICTEMYVIKSIRIDGKRVFRDDPT